MSTLQTGISGLLAFQRALSTTGHNIANASTEGYSRQRVEFSTNNPQRLGGHYLGQGVEISTVRRLQNDLVDSQLRTSLTNAANGDVRAAFAERVDRLLANESTGLAPVLENYFKSVQDVANDPTSLSARTVMLNEADTLTDRFAQINSQLEEQRTLVNGRIETTVEEINQYAESLADLNRQIVSGFVGGSPPNDLLDRRDNILNKLAEKIEVNTTTQDDGAVNVFIGNGQSLVMAGGANQLVADHLSGDPVNLDIGLKSTASGQPTNVTRFMTGGEIGGLLETRSGMIDTAQNKLGLVALNLATAFNEQNRLGLDLNGDPGQDIFTLPKVSVSPKAGNSLTASPGVTIDDVTKLNPNDYRLTSNGTDFRLTRLPDNTAVQLVPELQVTPTGTIEEPGITVSDASKFDMGGYTLASPDGSSFTLEDSDGTSVTLAEDPPGSKIHVGGGLSIDTSGITTAGSWDIEPTAIRTADGLSINTASIATATTGDSWLIQPTRFAADGLKVAITEPQEIAAAAAVKAESSDLNTGEATIESVRAVDASDPDILKARAIVSYDGTDYLVDDVALPAEAVTLKDGFTTITTKGWELKLKGTPEDGDEFIVSGNAGQEGDNRNILAMSDLQNVRLVQGQATIEGSHTSILASVGTQTRQAQITRDSSNTMLEEARAQREAISGVNLDEEAANMLRYQQAYQAAAQVISTTSTMFDTLLNAVR
ncbi:flagellar hook-associated protein FlgK [Thiocystis violacea]|uniref:flagellar hook-associated protein FlgK n=1 Tax=Thiocystis violacea TaxID=13725 RepID=UPI0019073B4A|nr:flagellar hook-associated protein FlgK [Thiocystis violacea]MBK1716745.1 flagellar hook-associated protein FlgK [Thiocystis violacea]